MKRNLLIFALLTALIWVWHGRYLQGIADTKDEYREYVEQKIHKGQEFFVELEDRVVKVYPLKGMESWNWREAR
jgi:hypothetical protein